MIDKSSTTPRRFISDGLTCRANPSLDLPFGFGAATHVSPPCLILHVLDRNKFEPLRFYCRHDGFDDLRGFRAVSVPVVQDDDRA